MNIILYAWSVLCYSRSLSKVAIQKYLYSWTWMTNICALSGQVIIAQYILSKRSNRSQGNYQCVAKISSIQKIPLFQTKICCIRSEYSNYYLIRTFSECILHDFDHISRGLMLIARLTEM